MQVLPIKKTDRLAAMLPVEEYKDEAYLLMATENGLIKKTPLSQFQDARANGLIAIKLKVSLSLLSQRLADLGKPACVLRSF